MDAKVTIVTKIGEVQALCYTADCSEAKPSLAKLAQAGYEEVNVIPKPIESQGVDSKLLFSIIANNDVEVHPAVKTLDMKRLKPGFPRPLSFKCFSASGESTVVQLVVKEGENIVEDEHFEVTCKKKEIKTVEGDTAAAFITGGQFESLDLSGSNIDVVASRNYNPTNHHHQGDFNCDKRETRIAQNMAENGGVMNITQHGTTNTQNVAKP